MKTSRPLALTLAIILLVLISLGSLATPLLAGPPVPVRCFLWLWDCLVFSPLMGCGTRNAGA